MCYVRCGRSVFVLFGVALLLPCAFAVTADAQSQPKYQVEFSLDRTGAHYLFGIQILYPDREYLMAQNENVTLSLAATRLTSLAGRLSVRYGLSLADKGYQENLLHMDFVEGTFERSTRDIRLLYLGAPVTLGFNLVNPRKGLKPFAEAGVSPDLLIHRERSEFLNFDLRSAGVSYLFSAGLKYNFGDGRSLVLTPEVRVAAVNYAGTGEPESPARPRDFRPIATGIKLGFQF